MRQFTKKRDIVRPGVTRFASSFLTLHSLAEKKSQLRHMFLSDEWEKCKFSKTIKGKAAYRMVEVKKDVDVDDAVTELVNTLFPEDHVMQNKILMVELPIYKSRLENFDRLGATKACEVNDENYDPANANFLLYVSSNWWAAYGGSTPHLRVIAMRILSLTTSSSGCERNWSTFEGVHTKKRNILEANRMNNLVYVQFNANLMEKNKKRKARGHEVLLADDASSAQEWIVKNDEVANDVDVAMGAD
ncbi:reverse transcriptase domain-containing protein [Tanacetum coccineum]|uniref:Reverse transcriptase domain-containing protein n=1 Tax=Tanacetum coccineum TaxID=301880 RepID=A0ABQ5BWS0_9ASTR